ncbi:MULTISPECIES: hypothetical protein [Gammaproteobacteria]|uniref:hypothetical protein n=1 Tax=Gammaproteobacteria TaxID=1236 RepID=UPI000DCF89E7|nr:MULTISPECIES: hypothetical protein [Gammaproteobacteria]RTE86189.1 hypothetical protein DQX04_06355 [Aliidiomarina sp. B3213]TCZ91541.1 hypothetical protein EYQ95_06365 [Lysobacter sp. N42]
MAVVNKLLMSLSLFLGAESGVSNCNDNILKILEVSPESCQLEILNENWGVSKYSISNFEGATVFLSVTEDENLLISPAMEGEVVLLENEERILVVGQSAHHIVQNSYLFDSNLREIKRIDHEPISYFGVSDDDAIFWLVMNKVEEQPVSYVRVFDSNGKAIGSFRAEAEEDKIIVFQGREYNIQVLKPEIPG